MLFFSRVSLFERCIKQLVFIFDLLNRTGNRTSFLFNLHYHCYFRIITTFNLGFYSLRKVYFQWFSAILILIVILFLDNFLLCRRQRDLNIKNRKIGYSQMLCEEGMLGLWLKIIYLCFCHYRHNVGLDSLIFSKFTLNLHYIIVQHIAVTGLNGLACLSANKALHISALVNIRQPRANSNHINFPNSLLHIGPYVKLIESRIKHNFFDTL